MSTDAVFASERQALKREHGIDDDDESKLATKRAAFTVTDISSPSIDGALLQVPDAAVALIIGPGGEQINRMQRESGAHIQINKQPSPLNALMRDVQITGPQSSVEAARKLIIDVVAQIGAPANGGGCVEEMLIPANKVGLVIGPKGQTINTIRSQSGADLRMIQDSHEHTGQDKPLRITGTKESVATAMELVRHLLNGNQGTKTEDNLPSGYTCRGEVVVPRFAVGSIIGRGGETINEIGRKSNTHVQFKKDDDPNSTNRCAIISAKTRDAIVVATRLITEIVHSKSVDEHMHPQRNKANNSEQDVYFMHVPASRAGMVIGRGGEIIKQINAESGAFTKVTDENKTGAHEKVFRIAGTPYQVHHAKHLIRIRVGDVPPGTPLPPFNGGDSNPTPTFQQQQQQPVTQFSYQPTLQQATYQPQMAGAPGTYPIVQQQQQYVMPVQQGQPGVPGLAPTVSYGGQQTIILQQPVASHSMHQQSAPQVIVSGQVTSMAAASNGTPQITDYSAQWIEYYRRLGMHDQAAAIENTVKARNAAAAASAT